MHQSAYSTQSRTSELKEKLMRSGKKHLVATSAYFHHPPSASTSSLGGSTHRVPVAAAPSANYNINGRVNGSRYTNRAAIDTPSTHARVEAVMEKNVRRAVDLQVEIVRELVSRGEAKEARETLRALAKDLPEARETCLFWTALADLETDPARVLSVYCLALEECRRFPQEREALMEVVRRHLEPSRLFKTYEEMWEDDVGGASGRRLQFQQEDAEDTTFSRRTAANNNNTVEAQPPAPYTASKRTALPSPKFNQTGFSPSPQRKKLASSSPARLAPTQPTGSPTRRENRPQNEAPLTSTFAALSVSDRSKAHSPLLVSSTVRDDNLDGDRGQDDWSPPRHAWREENEAKTRGNNMDDDEEEDDEDDERDETATIRSQLSSPGRRAIASAPQPPAPSSAHRDVFRSVLGSPALRVPTPKKGSITGSSFAVPPLPSPLGDENENEGEDGLPRESPHIKQEYPQPASPPARARLPPLLLSKSPGSARKLAASSAVVKTEEPLLGTVVRLEAVSARNVKAATPVRRSTRTGGAEGAREEEVLAAANYAYRPNPALQREKARAYEEYEVIDVEKYGKVVDDDDEEEDVEMGGGRRRGGRFASRTGGVGA